MNWILIVLLAFGGFGTATFEDKAACEAVKNDLLALKQKAQCYPKTTVSESPNTHYKGICVDPTQSRWLESGDKFIETCISSNEYEVIH